MLRTNKYIQMLNPLNFFRHHTLVLLVMVLISSFFTYTELTTSQLSEIQNPTLLIILIVIDLILILLLSILVARRIFRLWHKSKHQSGKLQNKIIFMFCLVAAVPTIIVTVFSTIFFNFGIQTWFDQRVSTAINESVVVAESYFRVQLKLIESDIKIMAQDINYLSESKVYGLNSFSQYLDKQAHDKILTEAVIFQVNPNKVIAHSEYDLSVPFATLPPNAIKEASDNNIVVMKADEDNKVRSLVKLDYLPNSYLLIGRFVDNKVLDHMINTKGAASEYERLRGKISNLQIQFLIIFIVVALLLLVAAIWSGLLLSSALVKPLNKLVNATEQIIEGNYSVNIDDSNQSDEISVLARAFNSMALQLGNQRNELIEANYEVDAKRHFSEAVLSGVSAGVVVLDAKKKISMMNPAAIKILSFEKDSDFIGKKFDKICKEIADLLEHTEDFLGYGVKKEIVVNKGSRSIILVVRILIENSIGKNAKYIITFDDITTLVLAQRSAAWADVARKVAHEIKNPLTPIQLASERLRRKYSKEVSDSKNFEHYLEIIIKHVKDIGTMVEEFVQFARMPAPHFDDFNLPQLVREAVFSRKCLDKNIDYILEVNNEQSIIKCDARQISQVLLNIFKNAEEAIENNQNIVKGEIKVKISKNIDNIELYIVDNGGGFSDELFDRLTEPYITSKSTGTGLGLAIVKKILDDHNAEVLFANNNQGATIKLIFKNITEGKI